MAVKHTVSAGLLLLSVPSFATEICMQNYEVKADQTRFVETQMRVATLQCVAASDRDMVRLYNAFVSAKRPYFIDAESPLRKFLKRTKRGSLDSYVVSLANRISRVSSTSTQFCERARFAMQMSAKMPNPVGLVSLMPVSYRQPGKTCPQVKQEFYQ